MSLNSLCRWQVQVSVYCAWRIPAHLRCTQCSILLHLMDICFLTCICLWQISQIQTRSFKVVGPGLVSTSPAFVSSSASHPAGPHGRHTQKRVNRAPIAGGGKVRHNCTAACVRCDSSTACRLCRLEPVQLLRWLHQNPLRNRPIYPQVKASSEWCRLWHNNWVDSNADRAVLCAGDRIQNRPLTHIRNV